MHTNLIRLVNYSGVKSYMQSSGINCAIVCLT